MLGGGGGRAQQWSRVIRGRSRVTTAGSWRWQEWGGAAASRLGGGGVPAVGSKGDRAESPLQHTIVLGRRVQAARAR